MLAPPTDLLEPTMKPGTRLGQYEIVSLLGAGGMGEVYRGRDPRLNRDVAIKVLPAAFATDVERLGRLRREAQLLAQLSHQNIAQLHGLEEHDGTWFLVMELAAGETLTERIGLHGPLPLTEAIPIATQLCAGLAAAHDQGIVHRDLKPANINVAEDPAGGLHVKILDFGLAKSVAVSDDTGLSTSPTEIAATREGVIQGTAPYMSPEQARGKPADRRTDIWAFGCVLYEMLTSRRAFDGETVSDVITAILSTEPDDAALPAGLPPALRRLLRRCLEKDPDQRLRDVGDARLELREAVDEIRGVVAVAGVAPTTGRRGSFWLATALALGIALAAGAGLDRWLSEPPASPAPPRIVPFTFSGSDFDPSASPDGRLIAFASGRDGRSRIWLKQRAGGGATPLTEGHDLAPRFSPDGESVLFTRLEQQGGSALYRVAILGGRPYKVVEGGTMGDWSSTGKLVYVRGDAARGDRLMVADADGANERELFFAADRRLAYPRFSPSGDRVAVTRYAAGSGGDRAVIIELATNEAHELAVDDATQRVSAVAWNRTGSALIYATTDSTTGDRGGQPSRVLLHDLSSGERRILLWAAGFFPQQGAGYEVPGFARLGEDSLLFYSVTTPSSLYEVDLQRTPVGELGRRITRGDGQDRQPVYSPDGEHVMFSSNRSGNLDLWVYDRTEGTLAQFTDDPADDWDPAFGVDGSILWSSSRSGTLEIWAADADGGNARQVTHRNNDAQNPTMTADGQWVIFASRYAGAPGIYRIRTDGSDEELVSQGAGVMPQVSPNGNMVQYAIPPAAGEPLLMEFVRLDSREIFSDGFSLEMNRLVAAVTPGRARWLGNDLLAFVAHDESGRTGISTQRVDVDQNTRATRRQLAGFSPDGHVETFGVSPDGRWMMLGVQLSTRRIMTVEGLTGLDE